MGGARWVVWLFLLQSAVAQVQHMSRAETDRFLLCARSTFQKPLYTTNFGPWFDAGMKCASDREELLRELREREITVSENDSAVLLLPPRLRPDIGIGDRQGRQVKWHKFEVETHAMTLGDVLPPGSRVLSKQEQDQIAKVIVDQALPVPLVPAFADVDDDTGVMDVDLILDAHHFSPETESVVALYGASGGDMRLVYGELAQGVYRMLWDTPLLWGSAQHFSHKDVDGDGIPEIVLAWTEPGGSVSYQALAVFNGKGEDLTRQEECDSNPPYAEAAQFVCPVSGSYIDFAKTASGSYDIVNVPNEETDPQDAERYTLINGHYSLPIPALTTIVPARLSVKAVSGKLTLTGRNFIRNSEVLFVQMAEGPSGNGTPREVRVRAEFVSSKELKARVADVLGTSDSTGDWQVRVQNASGHSESLLMHVEGLH